MVLVRLTLLKSIAAKFVQSVLCGLGSLEALRYAGFCVFAIRYFELTCEKLILKY
jgi:hypothetical protein